MTFAANDLTPLIGSRIETDKAGPMNVKLWRRVNNGPITSETKQMQASALGGGKFGDDWNKIENFTQTTTVQYMAEALGGTFAPQTPWKSITIHCNGDFAPTTSDANPDGTLPPAGPPAALTSEPHSFSRIFTGCFYDTVCNIFTSQAAQDEQGLLAAALTAGRLLIAGARDAPEVPRFFQAVGRAMILADEAASAGRPAGIGRPAARTRALPVPGCRTAQP